MYESAAKAAAVSFLVLGLGIVLFGVSNNPDGQASSGIANGLEEPVIPERQKVVSMNSAGGFRTEIKAESEEGRA